MKRGLRAPAALNAILLSGGMLLAAAPVSLAAQSWTDAERHGLLEALEMSARDFRAAIEGLSEAQWRFQEAEGRWSIEEVAEHLALTEELIGGMLTSIETAPAIDPTREGRAEMDGMLQEGLRDRSQRFQAPETVAPRAAYDSRQDMLEAFEGARARVIEFVKNTDVDLRSVSGEHPAFGPIDGHQWVLLLTSHVWRHLDQVAEVKAAVGFPDRTRMR